MADVSLAIPTYQSSAFLDELFACLRDLDPLPAELVILDDASTDDSAGRLDRFAGELGARLPVRVLHNPVNRGTAASYNRLAGEARGEWLLILDADDLLVEPDYFRRVAPALIPGNDVVITAMTSNARMLDRVARLGSRVVPRRPPAWLPLLGTVATRAGVLYRREVLAQTPFPEPAFPGSDVIHLLGLRSRHACVFVREAHVRYRVHAGAQSSRRPDFARFRRELRNQPAMTRHAHALDLWLRRVGQALVR